MGEDIWQEATKRKNKPNSKWQDVEQEDHEVPPKKLTNSNEESSDEEQLPRNWSAAQKKVEELHREIKSLKGDHGKEILDAMRGCDVKVPRLKLKYLRTASSALYIGDLAVLIYGKDTLSNSSLTGKQSGAHKDVESKQPLDNTQLDAILGLDQEVPWSHGSNYGCSQTAPFPCVPALGPGEKLLLLLLLVSKAGEDRAEQRCGQGRGEGEEASGPRLMAVSRDTSLRTTPLTTHAPL
ncbi:hypothetical protein ACEWY4_010939 [Coilia grayii]|uniref:BEN domain-containing protein n=1 Tax=Coilia grayii TaxID=363190 RepID=A0ABD1K3C5_9TELE